MEAKEKVRIEVISQYLCHSPFFAMSYADTTLRVSCPSQSVVQDTSGGADHRDGSSDSATPS